MLASSRQSAGSYDYIIIGAGPGGYVLDNRLPQARYVSVPLIAAGGKDLSFWIHYPLGYLYFLDNARPSCLFRSEK